ncbi:MAG TPA: VanW family protein [Roseiflexaceae bacterium]
MPDKYYQEYGPISRRRAAGTLDADEPPPELEPEPLPRPSRRGRPRRRRSFLRILLFILIVTGVALALPYATSLFATGRAMDGVSLGGQPIGGQGRGEILRMLEQRYASFIRSPLTISYEGRTWTPTLDQIGARFDLDQIAAEVLAAGHRGGPIERVEELWALWQGGLDVAPRITVDAGKLQAYLLNLAPEVERPPRDGALSIAEGKVLPTAAQSGRQALVDATAIDIVRELQNLEPAKVALRTRMLAPALSDDAVAHAADDARALLKGPLLLKRGPQTWSWDSDKIAEFLSIGAANGRMSVAVDRDRLARAVEKLAQIADSPSGEPRVAFRKGKLKITQQGKTGWRLKQPETVAAISATLRLAQREIELPAEELTPQVTAKTLPGLGIVELVGEGTTSYEGSAAYRITNIKAGAARMNGVLIPPGDEFSFNTQLGAVDETNGFVKGYAVIGNHTQLEWGGGVCQDSTTVFRAAFWAGLPITERHAHPFYISWYDAFSYPNGEAAPGMDATIFTGVADLKFVNDTGHWLLMEATTDDDNQTLTVRLYGTKPNRTVSVKGPEIDNQVPPPSDPVYLTDASLPAGSVKQTDHARAGKDITVYRIIAENGVQKPPELFFSRFKAWPDVFVRGTG